MLKERVKDRVNESERKWTGKERDTLEGPSLNDEYLLTYYEESNTKARAVAMKMKASGQCKWGRRGRIEGRSQT